MKLITPSDWGGPAFLMNFPLSVSNNQPNNVLMDPEVQGPYNVKRACEQWMQLYRCLTSAEALVYVLPGYDDIATKEVLQDLPFVANLAAYLPHANQILISNFTSEPRRGEANLGNRFFRSFDYQREHSPIHWEGEADLKWVRDNLYVGGVGQRSSKAAFEWMEDTYDMDVVKVKLTDPALYHLDCVFFPLTETKAIVNTYALVPEDIHNLERVVEILPVPEAYMYEGWTNCVRIGKKILHSPAGLPVEPFADLLGKHGFDLSCLVMHLNHNNRF
jgi:N-dimethylarginine dimethylaminohydrolase